MRFWTGFYRLSTAPCPLPLYAKAGDVNARRRAAYRAHIARRRNRGLPIPSEWWAIAGMDPNETGGLRRVAARNDSARRSIARSAQRAADRFGIAAAADETGIAGISRTERVARQAFLAEANRLLGDPRFDGIDPTPGQVSWIARQANQAARKAVEQALARENRRTVPDGPDTPDTPDVPEPEPFDRAKAIEEAKAKSVEAAKLAATAWADTATPFNGIVDPTDDEIRDYARDILWAEAVRSVAPSLLAEQGPEIRKAIDTKIDEFLAADDRPGVWDRIVIPYQTGSGRESGFMVQSIEVWKIPGPGRDALAAEKALREAGASIAAVADNDPEVVDALRRWEAAKINVASAKSLLAELGEGSWTRVNLDDPAIVDRVGEAVRAVLPPNPDDRAWHRDPRQTRRTPAGEMVRYLDVTSSGVQFGPYTLLPSGRIVRGRTGESSNAPSPTVARIDPDLAREVFDAAKNAAPRGYGSDNDGLRVMVSSYLTEAVVDARSARHAHKLIRSEKLREALAEVRPMGGRVETLAESGKKPSKSRTRRAIDGAAEFLPADWVEAMNKRKIAQLSFNVSGRGGGAYYERGKPGTAAYKTYGSAPYISASPDADTVEGADPDVPTVLHELTHHAERMVPGLVGAETTFYNRRTRGWRVSLRGGYETREDEFGWPYAGRDYGRGYHWRAQSWEVTTMGLESTFTGDRFTPDADYQAFILGAMASLARSDVQPEAPNVVPDTGRTTTTRTDVIRARARRYSGQLRERAFIRQRQLERMGIVLEPWQGDMVLVGPGNRVFVTDTYPKNDDGTIRMYEVTEDGVLPEPVNQGTRELTAVGGFDDVANEEFGFFDLFPPAQP